MVRMDGEIQYSHLPIRVIREIRGSFFGLRLSRAGFHSSFNQVDGDFDPFRPFSVRNSLSQHDLAMVDRFSLRASTCAGETAAIHSAA
jgi:hypothetical protein